MTCRVCGVRIEPDLELLTSFEGRPTANSYADCIYKCVCGAAYSNSVSEASRVLIWTEPGLNVPERVRDGLDDALSAACNLLNRSNKRVKFGFETSEDAVTWTVFRALEANGSLDALVIGDTPIGTPSLVLWGASVSGERAADVATALAEISVGLGEPADRRSEPDAIVVWDDLTVVVEAKYRSPNDRKSDYANFARYLDRAELFSVSTDDVKAAGWYELVRNWRIGIELAERLDTARFVLVNLGPPGLEASAAEFAGSLASTPMREFAHVRWAEIIDRGGLDESWFVQYAGTRGLYGL